MIVDTGSKEVKKTVKFSDLARGGALQCAEALTLGMPFEVWKTHMGRFRNQSTVESFKNIYKARGVMGFWNGILPKMFESGTKGAVLLFSKETINNLLIESNVNKTLSGFVSGALGGVCQVATIGPGTYIVTARVTGDKNRGIGEIIKSVYKKEGIRGFYPGGTAIAFRQGTNWASRQGFTEAVRDKLKKLNHSAETTPKLTVKEEALSGIIGGALSSWNHPFEVARIHMQAVANSGEARHNVGKVIKTIYKNEGVSGLYKGIIPRIGLGIWQTLFMVTVPKLL